MVGLESLYLSCVYVVDSIQVKPLNVDVRSCPYLRDLPLIQGHKQAQILIGQDNLEALLPLEVKKGARGHLFAVRTLFGWSVNGPAKFGTIKDSVVGHFISGNRLEEQVQSL